AGQRTRRRTDAAGPALLDDARVHAPGQAPARAARLARRGDRRGHGGRHRRGARAVPHGAHARRRPGGGVLRPVRLARRRHGAPLGPFRPLGGLPRLDARPRLRRRRVRRDHPVVRAAPRRGHRPVGHDGGARVPRARQRRPVRAGPGRGRRRDGAGRHRRARRPAGARAGAVRVRRGGAARRRGRGGAHAARAREPRHGAPADGGGAAAARAVGARHPGACRGRGRGGVVNVADLYTFAWRHATKVPEPVLRAVFTAVADVTWLRRGKAVRRMEANYARLRPELDEAAVRRLSRAGMRSYMRYFREAFTLQGVTPDQLRARVRVEGYDEHVRPVIADGGAAALALGHLGNWDLAGAYGSQNLAGVLTVAERLKPAELFDEFVRFRNALGIEVLPLGGGDVLGALVRGAKEG